MESPFFLSHSAVWVVYNAIGIYQNIWISNGCSISQLLRPAAATRDHLHHRLVAVPAEERSVLDAEERLEREALVLAGELCWRRGALPCWRSTPLWPLGRRRSGKRVEEVENPGWHDGARARSEAAQQGSD
jgi:hypothetical protein